MLLQHLKKLEEERTNNQGVRQKIVVTSPCEPWQTTAAHNRRMLTFCSNDYLGLANHPALRQALKDGVDQWGVGSGASHFINGHSQAHHDAELQLAILFGKQVPNGAMNAFGEAGRAKAVLFANGYMANLAMLTAFSTTTTTTTTTIFADKLNHASLVDGALLSKAKFQRYPHGDLARLAQQLSESTSTIKLIVTDAVFSMDGDVADLPRLLALAEQFDAWLIVDDAHGFGVDLGLGVDVNMVRMPGNQTPIGSVAQWGLCSERIIYMATLGKAAGISGAFVVADTSLIDALIQTARTGIYTTASPPALAHALQTSLLLMVSDEGQQRREQLCRVVNHFKHSMGLLLTRCMPNHNATLHLLPSNTAIQVLVVGDNATALAMSQQLNQLGLWVPAIRPPTVPVGTARLRFNFSAAHSIADVDVLLSAMHQILFNAFDVVLLNDGQT